MTTSRQLFRRQRTAAPLSLATLVLASSCTGVIKGDSPSEPPATDAGVAGPGMASDAGLADTGAGPEPPGAWTPPALHDEAPATPSPRLRIVEYRNTVSQAFELDQATLDGLLLASDGSDGKIFKTNAVERIGDFRVYVDAAQSLAEPLAQRLMADCRWAEETRNCLQTQLRPRIERLFRASVDDTEVEIWTTLYTSLRDGPASDEVALAAVLQLVLLDERFLFHREAGASPEALVTWVTEGELAARLSYLITNGPPDATLRGLVEAGVLKAQLSSEVRRMLASAAADDMIWRFVSGWLSLPAERPPEPPPPVPVDECNLTSECQERHGPQATDCVNSRSDQSWCACGAGIRCAPLPAAPPLPLDVAAWEETRRFVLHVFKSDTLPLTELFTARYSFIDATLAEHYGVPAPDQAWQRYDFDADTPRMGVLSHASFLMHNGSPERDVSWIFRGKTVYERMFCGELGIPMDGVISEEVEDRQNHPFCGGCHAFMDPLGKLFDAYDEHGRYIGTDLTMLPVLANSDVDGTYDGLDAFLARLDDSRAFDHCFVRMWFRFALGRPATQTDTESFEAALAALTNARTANSAMRALLEAEAFQALYRTADRALCE